MSADNERRPGAEATEATGELGRALGQDTETGGYSMVPHWVIREELDLSAYELLVYIVLLDRANRSGFAWPRMALLAQEARCSERTVKRALIKLQERGLVTVQRRPRPSGPHESNMYRVAVFDDGKPRRRRGAQRAPQRGADSPKEGRGVRPEVEPLEAEPDEGDMRPDLQADQARSGFSFPALEETSSRKQCEYLRDLWIHFYGEAPTDAQERELAGLSREDASARIAQLLRDMPRYDAYEGPEPGDDAYEALSDVGREWSDRGMLPDGPEAIR
ncbi:MAG: helix-turn-helix domain-containing protein [Actinomycetota bacterium]